jgi:hypothetical protein
MQRSENAAAVILRTTIAAIVLLAGCVAKPTLVWRHPGHSDAARFDSESLRCQQLAAAPVLEGHDYDRSVAVLVGARKDLFHSRYLECMTRLGYAQE